MIILKFNSYHPVCETDVGHDRHMRAEFFRWRTGRQPSKFRGSNRRADALVEESLYFRRARDIKGSPAAGGIYCCSDAMLVDEEFLRSGQILVNARGLIALRDKATQIYRMFSRSLILMVTNITINNDGCFNVKSQIYLMFSRSLILIITNIII